MGKRDGQKGKTKSGMVGVRTSETVLEKTHRQGRDHWQDEKDRLAAALERKILGRRSEVALRDILAIPLPDLLKVAFRNHALGVMRRERPLLLQSSHRFFLDDQQIKSHLRTLRDLLTDRLVLPCEEVRRLVVLGVRLQFDLITKPRATLEALLYGKAAERQRNDMMTIIVGLGEHRPMIAAVLDLLDEHDAGPVSKEAFLTLCRRAERVVYGEKPVTALMRDLQDLVALGAAADSRSASESQEASAIDNQTVLGMLFERNLKELAESLLPTLTQKESWSVAQLEKVLEHQIVAGGLALSDDEPGQVFLPADVDLSQFLEETKREVKRCFRDESGSETESDLPQSSQEPPPGSPDAQESEGTSAGGHREKSPVPPVGLHGAAVGEGPLFVRHEDIEHQPPGPYPSLHRLIDEKARKVFIKKMFRKDASVYFDLLERLEATQSWKSAKTILDSELAVRGINPYCKEAVRLSDLVFSRYFARR